MSFFDFLNYACQTVASIAGVLSVYLATRKSGAKRYASICGLIGQPCWFVIVIFGHQYLILPICFLYTWVWGQVFYRDFIKRNTND